MLTSSINMDMKAFINKVLPKDQANKMKGKFPARPSNKSRFLLWPCKIATSLFDPDFIFLPFHGPAVTSAVNSQLSDCEKTIVPLAHKQQILRSHGE